MSEEEKSAYVSPRTLRHRPRFAGLCAIALLATSCAGGSSDPVADTGAPLPVDGVENLAARDGVDDDPENAGGDPENAGDDPENAGDDPENAGDDPENAGDDPENTDDDLAKAAAGDGAGDAPDEADDDSETIGVDDVETATPTESTKRCNLYLHGAGWNDNVNDFYNPEGIHELQPPSPDGAFWLYDGPNDHGQTASTGASDYQRIVEYLRDDVAANDCGPLVVRGSSNGGGLAAKLYCRGEDFGGRAWAYIVDDPVMDVAVEGCSPSPRITRTYFTHSDELRDLAASTSSRDFDCEYAGLGWYCEDNTTMTLETYNSHIGTASVRSCATHGGEGCTYTLTGFHMNYVFWEEYEQ